MTDATMEHLEKALMRARLETEEFYMVFIFNRTSENHKLLKMRIAALLDLARKKQNLSNLIRT
jgi:hypothetical protein